jgi:D-xylose transport system substrate-binding protein
MKKTVLIVLALVIVGAGAVYYFMFAPKNSGTPAPQQKPIVIGLSMATYRTERWQKDRDIFVKRASELGAYVNVQGADDDADRQSQQVDSLIAQGVDILVVVAQDGEKAAAIVEKAHQAGIKVIAYDRLIKNSDLDYYISFDNVKVGESEAKGVLDVVSKGNFAYIGGSPTDNNAFLVKEGSFKLLQPKIDSGEIKIVLNEFINSWKPDLAYQKMKDYLAKNKTIDAVVVANDGMAAGVIQALSEFGLAGKVPVSGQDANLGACQNIVTGTQAVTIYKPIAAIANRAAEIAVAFAKKEPVTQTTTVNNGKIDVPSVLLDVIAVTKDNIQDTIIKDGVYSQAEIYGSKAQ